jgi:hypothetical protein
MPAVSQGVQQPEAMTMQDNRRDRCAHVRPYPQPTLSVFRGNRDRDQSVISLGDIPTHLARTPFDRRWRPDIRREIIPTR